MTKKMDHARYQRQVRQWDSGKLEFIIHDCKRTIELQPGNPNLGYYLDEINYCSDELARRQRREKRGYVTY